MRRGRCWIFERNNENKNDANSFNMQQNNEKKAMEKNSFIFVVVVVFIINGHMQPSIKFEKKK